MAERAAESDREQRGHQVRDVWVACAAERRDPNPSHLVSWGNLDPWNREVDMRIGDALVRYTGCAHCNDDASVRCYCRLRCPQRGCPAPQLLRYKRTGQIVEAVHLAEDMDWDTVAAWCGAVHEVTRDYADEYTSALIFSAATAPILAFEGDWIINAGPGSPRAVFPLQDALVAHDYEEVER
jgi:hypothetical protein